MTDKNKTSVKLSEDGILFLDKINTNRIRCGIADRQISRCDILDKVIARYFKSNNDKYLEMIKQEEEKNE